MIKYDANEELIGGVLSQQYFLQASYIVDYAATVVFEISTDTFIHVDNLFSPFFSWLQSKSILSSINLN